MLKNKWIPSKLFSGLIHAVSWSVTAAILSRFLTLLASVIVARTLSKSEFGEYSLALSTVYLFAGISSFGLNVIATKVVAETKAISSELSKTIYGLQLLAFMLAIIGVSAFWVLRESILSQVPGSHDLNGLMVYAGIFLFGLILAGVQSGILFGLECFKHVAILNILHAVVSVFLQIYLVGSWSGDGAIIALGISQAFQCIGFQYLISRSSPRHIKTRDLSLISIDWIIRTLKQSLPIFLSGLMVMPVGWMQNIILARQHGGLTDLAVIGLAGQWKMAILFVPGVLASIIIPKMIQFHQGNDYSGFYKFFKLNLYLCAGLGSVLMIFAYVISYKIGAIYGVAYEDDQWVFVCFALVAVLMAVNGVVGQVITSIGMAWIGLVFNFAWACTVIVSTYYCVVILPLGALGVAYAYVIAYFAHCIWQFAFVKIYFLKRIDVTKS